MGVSTQSTWGVASRQSVGSGCSASSRSALLFNLFGILTYWKSEDIRHPQKVFNTPQRKISGQDTFWQENYQFIKEIYEMRHTKMAEWMENVEKAISRIMADKVYTSAEFKRERDNFHALCKDLEREEIKKWLKQILEILMAERSKEERGDQNKKLEGLIVKHEELIPTVLATQIKVDLYWKCYAYGA